MYAHVFVGVCIGRDEGKMLGGEKEVYTSQEDTVSSPSAPFYTSKGHILIFRKCLRLRTFSDFKKMYYLHVH